MSFVLAEHGIEHIVLERGEVAHAWRTERWDSLRLLTPNWMSRLPGFAYEGDDPLRYMSAADVVAFISGYARFTAAPVRCGHTVLSVKRHVDGYRVVTDRGDWSCRAVVLATGACSKPSVPAISQAVPAHVRQLTAMDYRNPAQLDDGGVLVVGASATGVQLAEEIHASGRPVTLAVGEHVRVPRIYRGRDVYWWMLAAGVLDQSIEEVDDPVRARGVPSPQLIGTPERRALDLNVLARQGVGIVGRLAGVRDGKAQFSGSLNNVCALADLKMNRLLAGLDEWADARGISADVGPVQRYAPTGLEATAKPGLDFASIRTIVWATGFRPDFSWLDVPVFDHKQRLRHSGGVVAAPGLYVLGLPYLRRRKSSFIHGAEDDARDLGVHLATYMDRTAPVPLRGVAI